MTGAELGAGGSERRESFALQPGEPVASFNMVTSLMPLASGSAPQTYRWALGLGLLIPVLAGALGYLAFAFVAAALVVPAIYVVYMYDVNEWEDQPLPVVLGTVAAAAALGVGFTFLWHAGLLGDEVAPVDFGQGAGGVRWTSLLVLVLLVPVVSELLKQVGPLFLASRPQFDDMIDGAHLRCRGRCELRGRRDDRRQPLAVQQLRLDRQPRRGLLGLPDPVRRHRQADRLRRRHRHRRRRLVGPRRGLRRLQAGLPPRPR